VQGRWGKGRREGEKYSPSVLASTSGKRKNKGSAACSFILPGPIKAVNQNGLRAGLDTPTISSPASSYTP
jgi:hypothetical protein